MKAFVISHTKSWDWKGREIHGMPHGLFSGTRALLLDPDVDALIVAVQTDEIASTGLPFTYITELIQTGEDLISYASSAPADPKICHQVFQLLKSSLYRH